MEYKKLYLSILIAVGVGTLFAVMSAFWVGFLCFFGIALLVSASLFFIVQRQKYSELKERIYQQRYVDAYNYADQNGQKLDVAHFKYPRKKEAEFKGMIRDGAMMYFGSILLCLFCVVVVIMICINVF